MTLREQLDSDLKEAMRARDQVRVDTIRGIKSAVKYKEVEGGEAKAHTKAAGGGPKKGSTPRKAGGS